MQINNSNKDIISNLSVYGLTHAVIDAACAAAAFSLVTLNRISPEYFVLLVVAYNLIAFGIQPLFGLLFDRLQKPKLSALIGACLTITALLFASHYPLVAVILAGLGNALFHIGGGTISLNLIKNKATAPAIFVAPGAIGLLIGTMVGKSEHFSIWPFILIISFLTIIIYFLRHPSIEYDTSNIKKINYLELTIILLFLVIAVRSFIGTIMVFPWKSNILLLIILTCAIVLGKAFGGILGDRFGWTRTAVFSLIVSAPLLAFGSNSPFLAILGIFLFNMTMPITLVAISNMLPGRPGFSFGLTTLALILGVIPTYIPLNELFKQKMIILIVILISAATLYVGLWLHDSNKSK
ncbi:MAG: hypothetical protein ACP5OA_07375 [Candidatus Woesearchaeota archaeon]